MLESIKCVIELCLIVCGVFLNKNTIAQNAYNHVNLQEFVIFFAAGESCLSVDDR